MNVPKLRDYQLDSVEKVHSSLNLKKHTMLQLPTGGGKSLILSQIVEDYRVKNKRVLIQVHRKELVSQLSLALCKFNMQHNIIAPANVVRQIVGSQRAEFSKQFYNHKSNIMVGSVDTINARSHKLGNTLKNIDLVITDEAAHVLKKNKWGRCIDLFPDSLLLGLTATPQRLDKKGLGSWNDGFFDVMIQGPKVRWLIDSGYLSKYKIVAPASDFEKNLGEVKSNTTDFSNEVIKDAAKKSQIVGDVVENYIKFADGTQAIVFAPTIDIGVEIQDKFIDAGIAAKFLSSLSNELERFNSVKDFRDNKIQVLLNVDLFDEGFDVGITEGKRIIETVIIARPTMSLGKFLQTVGRGLRPAPNKEHALIIDHVGNIKRHGLPCAERKWSLERPKKRKMHDGMVRICHECAAAYPRFDTECPYCGAEVVRNAGSGEGGRVPPEMVEGDLFLIDPDTIREMENSTLLETPEHVAMRVSMAAGVIAGKSAAKHQRERIEVQSKLKEVIATWAGKKRDSGQSDRAIHKEFYLTYDMTIAQSLAEPKAEMKELIEEIESC